MEGDENEEDVQHLRSKTGLTYTYSPLSPTGRVYTFSEALGARTLGSCSPVGNDYQLQSNPHQLSTSNAKRIKRTLSSNRK